MIWENIIRRIDAVYCLLKHLRDTRGLSTSDKSSYYRSVLIVLYSIVEGLTYELVKKNTNSPDHIFEKIFKYTKVCDIHSSILGTSSNVNLYRKNKADLGVDDEGATFARYNLFLKHKGVVNKAQYETLNWIRKERNKLHVQGLKESDVNYTKAKTKRVSRAINFLVKKV